VHPALWLLIGLRFRGWLRRLAKNVHTAKGALTALVGVLFLLPCCLSWIVSLWVLPAPEAGSGRLEQVQRFGPFGLLGFCLLTLVSSSGERAAIPFTPEEVTFLFAGPFSRRQLLAYKLMVNFLSVLVLSAFLLFTMGFLRVPSVPLAAQYVGLVLTLVFTQLLAIALGFVAATIGVSVYNRGRKLVLIGIGLVLLAVLIRAGRDSLGYGPLTLLERAEHSTAVQLTLEPFRWFVDTVSAPRLWPDFVRSAGLALAVDLALLVLVFVLDAQYLESSAEVSERIYAQLQRIRRGGTAALFLHGSGRVRFGLPAFPWWGGVGPVAWRQLLTVPRSRASVVLLLLLLPVATAGVVISLRKDPEAPLVALVISGQLILVLTLFLTPLVAFDFRGDVERMDILKALPISPSALAVGQLVAPVLLVTLVHWIALAGIGLTTTDPWVVNGALAAAALAVPFNFLVFAIDNLLFLLFPNRPALPAGADFQAVGRQTLTVLAKGVALMVVLGAAMLLAVVAYFLTGSRWLPALMAAWLVLAGAGVGFVPLLALAFRYFDVSRDTPP
jgi:hypothetical protein